MWCIAKYKKNEFNKFQNSLTQALPGLKIVRPVYLKNKLTIPLLGTYCFLHHSAFASETTISALKYKQGVNYFLSQYKTQQSQIRSFLEHIQQQQDSEGYLNPSFFYQYLVKQGVFLEGALKSMIFTVLAESKKTLTVFIDGWTFPFNINKETTKINFL